jgi:dTDP-4-amino-4,6-dideoxygalactose transaminase
MRAPDFPNKNVAAMRIPFDKPHPTGKELAYISEAIAAGHLSGDGMFSAKCRCWLEDKLGCAMALLVPSCTAALEMAAILCELKAGDEVIMPAFHVFLDRQCGRVAGGRSGVRRRAERHAQSR